MMKQIMNILLIYLGIMLCISPCNLSIAEEEHADHAEEEHADHAEEEHADHAEEGLRLTTEQRKRFRIEILQAGQGSLHNEIRLTGKVVFNEDRVVHMVPRVSGIVRQAKKTVGDRVKAGEIVAVIDSRELADAKAEYMASSSRKSLAEKSFSREKQLHDKKISSEQDFLEAEEALAEASIILLSAEQKLNALGLTGKIISKLEREHDQSITRYEIKSPIDGVVTRKHLSLGESLEANSDIFTVVDASSVWVNLAVYTKNLGSVAKDQEVTLQVDHSGAKARGKVAMVTPFVDEATRSATARVVLDNTDGRWIPGTFVTGFISTSAKNLKVVVPRHAIQDIKGRNVVFVEHEGAFEMVPVKTGRSDRENIEVLSGLKAGDSYVSNGAFELKATVITSNLDSHAGHGH